MARLFGFYNARIPRKIARPRFVITYKSCGLVRLRLQFRWGDVAFPQDCLVKERWYLGQPLTPATICTFLRDDPRASHASAARSEHCTVTEACEDSLRYFVPKCKFTQILMNFKAPAGLRPINFNWLNTTSTMPLFCDHPSDSLNSLTSWITLSANNLASTVIAYGHDSPINISKAAEA